MAHKNKNKAKEERYYLRTECWLPKNKCLPDSTVEGRCRFWPEHMDEHYAKAYPKLHKRISEFKRI